MLDWMVEKLIEKGCYTIVFAMPIDRVDGRLDVLAVLHIVTVAG